MMSPEVRAGIFAGESGGDYDALFGFSNRPGGPFDDVRLTDMTVDDALAFADPGGPYGQWTKGQIGRVATPMGAYQVVGTTLRAAKNALGLTGQERMTPELQDAIGDWILQAQGVGAWEGYKGPADPSTLPTADYAGGYEPPPANGNALRGYAPEPDTRQQRMNALMAYMQPDQQMMPSDDIFGAYLQGRATSPFV